MGKKNNDGRRATKKIIKRKHFKNIVYIPVELVELS